MSIAWWHRFSAPTTQRQAPIYQTLTKPKLDWVDRAVLAAMAPLLH
jgi:hypothetical protein